MRPLHHARGDRPEQALRGGHAARAKPSSQVPEALDRASWRPVCAGRWKAGDHITLGEARAALVLLRLLAGLVDALHHKFSSLEDNMAVAGAWRKGRSSAFGLNRLMRKRAALCLASGIELVMPWIDTRRMPADQLSRTCPH